MTQLKQKIEHDQNFLEIFSVVDPGSTRLVYCTFAIE